MAVTNEKISYYNDTAHKCVFIKYTFTSDVALSAGKTAAEIIARVEALIAGLDLPAVNDLRILKNKTQKYGDDYIVTVSLRYFASEGPTPPPPPPVNPNFYLVNGDILTDANGNFFNVTEL